MHRRHQETEEHRDTLGKRGSMREERATGNDEIALEIVSVQETCSTNPTEKTGSGASLPELSIYSTN